MSSIQIRSQLNAYSLPSKALTSQITSNYFYQEYSLPEDKKSCLPLIVYPSQSPTSQSGATASSARSLYAKSDKTETDQLGSSADAI